MQTEDQPLDYRYFEVVIPKGQYGAWISDDLGRRLLPHEVEVTKGVREQIKEKKANK